jgi:radical SAM superfamily enzyme
MDKTTKNKTQKTLEQIAATHLGIETLATRNHDSLDFHEVSACCVKAALEAAYEAGRKAASPKIHIRPDANTYAGQEARIIHVSTTVDGHKLYALKTVRGTVVATAWDDADCLRQYAASKYLDLQNEGK